MVNNTRITINDLLLNKYTVTTTRGKKYSLVQEGQGLLLREGENTLGRILKNDPLGGSIWRGEAGHECLGEYDLRSGEYVVIPYVDLAKRTDLQQLVHPLDYLITKIEEKQMTDYKKAFINFAESIGSSRKETGSSLFYRRVCR